MNLKALEQITRQAIKGSNIMENSSAMLKSGFITPTEHRSVTSLSHQIAANVRANGGAAAGVYARTDGGGLTNGWWC